jgi:hypothetical protein
MTTLTMTSTSSRRAERPTVTVPAGAVSAIRTARSWPVFAPNARTQFWINTLLTVVAIAASYGAAIGQAGFAELYLGMHGPERYVVFLIIEATAVALMLLANQTALAGDSAGGLWVLVWATTAGAVTMQIVHANAIGHPEAAMVYATASVLTVVLWRAKTRRALRDRLRAAGMIEDPLPRYRPVRWVLRPRETFRGWYLALGEGVSDPATAMDMARADLLFHRSASAARAAARRARKAGTPGPDLSGQQHVVPPWRVTHPDAHRFGVLPWHQHTAAPHTSTPADDTTGTDVPVRLADADAGVPRQVPVRLVHPVPLDVTGLLDEAAGLLGGPGDDTPVLLDDDEMRRTFAELGTEIGTSYVDSDGSWEDADADDDPDADDAGTPVPGRRVAVLADRTSTPRKTVTARTGTDKRIAIRTDAQLIELLAGVPRDADGTVPVRRAAAALGCGPDRARKLLDAQGLLKKTP